MASFNPRANSTGRPAAPSFNYSRHEMLQVLLSMPMSTRTGSEPDIQALQPEEPESSLQAAQEWQRRTWRLSHRRSTEAWNLRKHCRSLKKKKPAASLDDNTQLCPQPESRTGHCSNTQNNPRLTRMTDEFNLKRGSLKRKNLKNAECFKFGTWNVRSLVENSGPVEIATAAETRRHGCDAKKDQLVMNMKELKIEILACQETLWFGQDQYEVNTQDDSYLILTSGSDLPPLGSNRRRRAGVCLFLSPKASQWWHDAGSIYNPISERLLTAHFLINEQLFIFIVVYAPTQACTAAEFEVFMDALQDTIDNLPRQALLFILGDFNSRVGSLTQNDNAETKQTIGRFGAGERDDRGDNLISFSLSNELVVANTLFPKSLLRKWTWTNPSTRRHSTIDYILLSKRCRRFLTDTQTEWRADCFSDHNLLAAEIRMPKRKRAFTNKAVKHRLNTDSLKDEVVKQQFNECLTTLVNQPRSHDNEQTTPGTRDHSLFEKQIIQAAESVLGRNKKQKDPEWFVSNLSQLKPLIEAKDRAFAEWKLENNPENRNAAVESRRIVRNAVQDAKNRWVCSVSSVINNTCLGTGEAWAAVRKLQSMKDGPRAKRQKALNIRDDSGQTLSSPEALNRWKQYFSELFEEPTEPANIEVIEQLASRCTLKTIPEETLESLRRPPEPDEIKRAVGLLKPSKSGGFSEIDSNLIKSLDDTNFSVLSDAIREVFETGNINPSWIDVMIVPLPKSGDLTQCSNWRGVTIVDMFGKVISKILQGRMNIACEHLLAENQCGFRPGRGCPDLIYSLTSLSSNAKTHGFPLHAAFVDLRKAFDTVQRNMLKCALSLLGIPDNLIKLVMSLHDGMEASIRVDNTFSPRFPVSNGVRQGDCSSPALFVLFFHLVILDFESRAKERNLSVSFVWSENKERSRRTNDDMSFSEILSLAFADDVTILAASRSALTEALRLFQETISNWGLSLNIPKTKAMMFGSDDVLPEPIEINGGQIEYVKSFKYLGTTLSSNCKSSDEVTCRIAKAAAAFGALSQSIFRERRLSTTAKVQAYKSIVLPILLYASETWIVSAEDNRKMEVFHNRCCRTIAKISRLQQRNNFISSQHILSFLGLISLTEQNTRNRLRWLGHLYRMHPTRIPRQILFSYFQAPRRRGGQFLTCDTMMENALACRGVANDGRWKEAAEDRDLWKRFVEGENSAISIVQGREGRPIRAAATNARITISSIIRDV
jgi:hypothetical protein